MTNMVVKKYPNYTKVLVYASEFEKKIDGFELQDSVPAGTTRGSGGDTARSLRRTKTTLQDLTICNEFDLFATFTFNKNRQDIEKCKTKMSNWLHSQQKKYGKFQYLIVPEFHKDGKSLHFHALLKNYRGVLKDSGKIKQTRKIYNIKSYRSGFSTAVKIDDHAKVSSYIRKYITKEMPQFENKQRYWCSVGLLRPQTEYLNADDYALDREDIVFENGLLTIYQTEHTLQLLS